MEHRILREGGARDEGAAHRDGEGRAGLEGVEAGILLGGGAGARGLRCPSGAAGGNTRPAAAGMLAPPPGGAWAARWEREALSQGLHGRPAGQGGLPPLPAVGGIPHRRRDPPHPGVPEPGSTTPRSGPGGPHGVTLRQGSAWALPGGSPLTLGELFPPGFRWRAWALAEVERQLRVWLSAGESWFAPDWRRGCPAASTRSVSI